MCMREGGGVGAGAKRIVDNYKILPVHYNIIKFNCLAPLELLKQGSANEAQQPVS